MKQHLSGAHVEGGLARQIGSALCKRDLLDRQDRKGAHPAPVVDARLCSVLWMRRLRENVVTPTTKAADHDVPISPEEIVAQGLVSQEDWHSVRHDAPMLATACSVPAFALLSWYETQAMLPRACLHIVVSASA